MNTLVMDAAGKRAEPGPERELRDELAVSAALTAGPQIPAGGFDQWLESRRRAHPFEVTQIPFADLDGWAFHEDTGNLGHRSGGFFRVEGLDVRPVGGSPAPWRQPILVQPESGVLGILAQKINGVLHFLMQVKMEPGNRGLLQISPTVQATRSNFTGLHRGASVRYLEYFTGPRRGRIIVDVLQSEHAWWFYRKNNRNMIVEVASDEDVPLHDDFCWLPLGALHELMARDNLVNMCTRSILSCLPYAAAAEEVPAGGVSSAVDGPGVALNSTPEVLSWFTGLRADLRPEIGRIPLRDVPGWQRTEKEIARYDGRYFKIIAVSVQAASREVSGWTQPLLEPNGPGLAAGIVKEFGGVLHVMMHAKVEGGLLNVAELGPTVQCRPGDFAAGERPLFHDYVTEADPARIRFDAVQPEEGGRFSNAETRCLVVEADDSLPAELPPDYIWITLGQLTELLRHGQYVNMHGRTLIACLHAMGRRA